MAAIVLGQRKSESRIVVEKEPLDAVRERRSQSSSAHASPLSPLSPLSPSTLTPISPSSGPSSPPLTLRSAARAATGPRFSLGTPVATRPAQTSAQQQQQQQSSPVPSPLPSPVLSPSPVPMPTLEEVVESPELSRGFGVYLNSLHASEGLRFLCDVARVERELDAERRAGLAAAVYERYIREGGDMEVNLSGETREQVALAMAAAPAMPDLFTGAASEIRQTLATCLLSQWLATGTWKSLVASK
jgi:hypothetical protein